MATIHFDPNYAPCGFLIVRDNADPYSDDPKDTVLIQTDWDYPGVASKMGWTPCKCGATDGTVDCHACNRHTSDMIGEAYNFIRDHDGDGFPALDQYLPE